MQAFQKKPFLKYGPKKTVRPGDILLLDGINIQVIHTKPGKYIIYRCLHNTRSHGYLDWDSPLYKRDPFYKKRQKDKEHESKRLYEFLEENNLGEKPCSWSYEYAQYKERKKKLVNEYYSLYSSSNKNQKKQSSKQKKNYQKPKIPKTSIFDNIKLNDYSTNNKHKKSNRIGNGLLPGDRYNSSRFCNYDYTKVNESHLDFIKRMKDNYSNDTYNNNTYDNYDYYNDSEDNLEDHFEVYEPLDDNNDNLSESSNEDIDFLSLFSDDDSITNDEIEIQSMNDTKNKNNEEIQEINEEINNKTDDIEDISIFQTPSLYSNNINNNIEYFEIESSINKSVLTSNHSEFKLSSLQQSIIENTERLDNSKDILINIPDNQSQYSLLYYTNDNIKSETNTFNLSTQIQSTFVNTNINEDIYNIIDKKDINFNISSIVQSSYKVNYFGDSNNLKSDLNDTQSDSDDIMGLIFDNDSESIESEGEICLLFE